MSKNKILFTGGGSAGHVTPNLALIRFFQLKGWQAVYIGSQTGIERQLIQEINIPYYPIYSDKLRRQLHWRNLVTPFKVVAGIWQAIRLCRRLKPDVIFSKGGFVSFPVVLAGWLNRIPVIIHESDLTLGLTTRLSIPFASSICLTFAASTHYFKGPKNLVVTGTPLRDELRQGNKEKGLALSGLTTAKPILLVMGGSLGSAIINQTLQQALPQLLDHFQIIHLCGKGKVNPEYQTLSGYRQFEYLTAELADILACADLVISRAGANSLYELLALGKPHILIPLSKKASRGDQIDNARYFAEQGFSYVIFEEKLSPSLLIQTIQQVYQNRECIRQKLQTFQLPDSCQLIYEQAVNLLPL